MLRFREKISHRFFVAIMLIVVIPLGIISYESYVPARRTLTTYAYQHIATIAENKANHLGSWLEERLVDVGLLAGLSVIREACRSYSEYPGTPTEIRIILKDNLDLIEGTSPSYENIYILLLDGRVLSSTHPDPVHTQGFYEQGLLQLVISPQLSLLAQLGLSRVREFDADQTAARLTGDPGGLAAALAKIERISRSWRTWLMPGWGNPEPSWLRTHPATEARIARLLKLLPPQQAALRSVPNYFASGSVLISRSPRWYPGGFWR